MSHHCQICERVIKANTGVIAHHGYKRPGHGWQTSSCFGARHLPYEKGWEAIPTYIEWLKMSIKQNEKFISERLNNPPALLTERRTDAYGRLIKEYLLEKPADFDVNKEPASYRMYSYEHAFWPPIKTARLNILQMRREIERMDKRLANWKKVA